MGFLSKIWKGIKKTVKKIFKPIKRVFKSIGKFMGKIGIVGQIAMSFILPGIGSALAGTFSNVVGGLMGGALGSVGKAAGWVLGKAGEFAKMAYKGYKTVTGAITDFVGTTGKYVGGKLGIGENMSLSQAFGSEGWGGRLTDSFSKLGDAAGEFFDTDVKGVTDPYRGPSLESIEGKTSVDVDADIQDAINIGDVQGPPKITGALPYGDVESYTYDPVTGMAKNIVRESDSILGRQAPATKAIAQEQSVFSKGLEMMTGEKDLAGVGSAFAKRTGQYIMDVPGKALAGAAMEKINPQEVYDPGPAWGSQYYQQTVSQPTMAFQQATAEMPMPSFYQNYVASSPLMGDSQGSWLGENFWQRELQARVA